MNCLVSIILPAYNCEKYVSETINSVLEQTYQNFELIIINDGSTDGTVKKVKEFLKKDSRIRFFNNEKNLGVSLTRNKGISLANGEWIAFIDSDDLWEKDKLAKQIAFAKETGAQFTFTGSSFIDENGEFYEGILQVPQTVSYRELLKQNIISCSSVLIKKNIMAQFKMEKDEAHEDYGSWLRILKTGILAYGLNEPLLVYRISKKSKSSNKIKSLIMAYRTYRFVGLNRLSTIYYLSWYVVKGIKKYRNIKRRNKT